MSGDFSDKFNALLQSIMEKEFSDGIPSSGPSRSSDKDKKFTFPKGVRYHFYSATSGCRKWRFCYCIHRNENGKFVSWIYQPAKRGKATGYVIRRLVEHRRKKSAKARAEKLRNQFQTKSEARKKKGSVVNPD